MEINKKLSLSSVKVYSDSRFLYFCRILGSVIFCGENTLRRLTVLNLIGTLNFIFVKCELKRLPWLLLFKEIDIKAFAILEMPGS